MTSDQTAPGPAPDLLGAPLGRQRSPLWFAWRRFLANRAAVTGGVVLGLIALMAIFAPLITPAGPNA